MEVGGVGEQFLGNAADVDAGAAELPGLGDADAGAVGRADAAGANPAGAAADGEEVVVLRQGVT
jgi:hypothetical protein